jgi:M6 family metalloprotease-like protein
VMLTDGNTHAGVQAFTFDAKHIAAGGPGLFTTVRVEWMTPDTATTTIRARSMILLVKPHAVPDLAESPALGLGYTDGSGAGAFRVEPMRGTRYVLAIIFDPSRPGNPTPSVAAIDAALFGASESVADYYRVVSGGQLEVKSAGVLGPYPSDHPWEYYANGPGDHQDTWVEAVTKADDDFDYSDYDFDGDGYLSSTDELAVIIVVPQTTPDGFVRPLWSGDMPVTQDGVYIDLINEWYISNPAGKTYLGAHEFGHQVLVLNDLYAKSGSTIDVGTRPGVYCLMDGGGYQVTPHLNPAYKLALGWVTPRLVTATSQQSLEDVKTSREIIVLPRAPGGPADEYVLVENRPSPATNARYDFDLPDAGLAVWHIVESESDRTIPPGCTAQNVWDTQTGGEPGRAGIRLVRPGIVYSDPTSLWSNEHYDLDGFGLVCPGDGPPRNVLLWADGVLSYELRNFPAASGYMTLDIVKP